MAKYKIISDSGCDISKENEARYNIDLMPFEITLGDNSFWERHGAYGEEFLHLINDSPEMPKTAQITEFRFEEKFAECVSEGYDEVLVVLINGTGSQTFSNAVQAEKKMRESGKLGNTKFYIIDSHTYSLGYGYPLIEAAKKLEAGQNMDIVVNYLEDWFASVELYITGFNLRHMKKSGRIKAAAAFLGELMNLKPLIALNDGESVVLKKSRGEKAAIAEAVNYIAGRAIPKTPFVLVKSLRTAEEEEFIKQYQKKTGSELAMSEWVGCAVGSNIGTEFLGVFVKGQRRR